MAEGALLPAVDIAPHEQTQQLDLSRPEVLESMLRLDLFKPYFPYDLLSCQ